MSIVSIIRCEDYLTTTVDTAVRKALRLAELDIAFLHERSVLLKPNLLSTRKPEEAVTTHPEVVKAVGKLARDHGCRLALGDSPPFAGERPDKYARLCETTGMSAVAEHLDAEIVRFEEYSTTVTNPMGRYYRSFEIAQCVMKTDVMVNIPKLKTHGLTSFSGAVKNVFGCVPGIRKGLFHVQAAEDREAFAQMIVDLLQVIRPRINIMDAVVAMEGDGPNSGKPIHIGIILASSDPVALDAVACAIVGIDPLSVATTRLAHEQGLGCGDIAKIEIRGQSIESVRVYGFKQSSGRNDWARIPSPIRKVLRRQLVALPVISPSECTGCGECATACPVNAIKPGRPAKIDLAKCIRCYCCHEVCNWSAIELRRELLGNLLFRLLEKR